MIVYAMPALQKRYLQWKHLQKKRLLCLMYRYIYLIRVQKAEFYVLFSADYVLRKEYMLRYLICRDRIQMY